MRIRLLPTALLGAALALPTAASAEMPRPGVPVGLKATLEGTSLKVTWRKATFGEIQIKARVKRRAGKAVTTRGTATAKKGKRTVKVTDAGKAPSAAQVTFRARRCINKKPLCGPWSKPLAPTVGAKTPIDGAGKTPTPGSTPAAPTTPAAPGSGPRIGSCPLLPESHSLNQDVSGFPVDPRSDAYVRNIGVGARVHPDFGAADLGQGPGGFGIPYRIVPESQPLVRTQFGDYADESDPGSYPIPLDTPVEGGPDSDGDRHVLVVREGECKLYELGNAYPRDGFWEASGGAIWDLGTGLRPPHVQPGWTSVDAAGLPVLPGLVRYDEVAAGEIRHAVRFTVQRTQRAYIAPASHWASSITDPDVAPMGLRLRMKASYDLSKFKGQSLVIATALKRYGMIVADNGSNWFISGAPDTRWNDDDLSQLKTIPGSAFEAVQTGSVVTR